MTELAVLVPVLARPQNVAPLVESFLADCPADACIRFIVSYGDQEEWDEIQAISTFDTWRVSGTMISAVDTWPQKINFGVDRWEADWYLFAADDIRFHPGWWDATAPYRDQPEIGVIGTNDLGNPRVIAGEHTTHPLVRASYIKEYGTIDEPGKAVHDGYHHWCVDDELVNTAKIRGAWAFCDTAVVEHLHPYWKKADWDATYTLGESHANEDLALWRERASLLGLVVA